MFTHGEEKNIKEINGFEYVDTCQPLNALIVNLVSRKLNS